jgi:hypothetical protein
LTGLLFDRNIADRGAFDELATELFDGKAGSFTTEDLEFFNDAGVLSRLQDKVTNPGDRVASQYLLGETERWREGMDELLQKDFSDYIDAIERLKEIGASSVDLGPSIEQGLKSADSLVEFFTIAERMESPPDIPERLLCQMGQHDLAQSLTQARDLDARYGTSYTGKEFAAALAQGLPMDVNTIIAAYHPSDVWKDAVHNITGEAMRNGSVDECIKIMGKIVQGRDAASGNGLHSFLDDELEQIASSTMEKISDPTSFLDYLSFLKAANVKLDPADTLEHGNRIGCPHSAMLEIIGKKVELLEEMIDGGLDDFGRYYTFIKDFELGEKERENILRKAGVKGISTVFGAFGHVSLGTLMKDVKHAGISKYEDLVLRGMSTGDGTNLLLQWYACSENLPLSFKKRFEKIAKETLLDLGFRLAKHKFGFIRNGGLLEQDNLRVYIDGDSIDVVDIDETIENVIDQGKSCIQITPDDIVCAKESESAVKVVFALDTSGSMSGAKLVHSAITVCALLFLMKPEDIALVFFESDTHVVKEFDDTKSVDKVASELLALKSMGGTMVTRTLEFIATNFKRFGPEELLYAIIVSDFEFNEDEDALRPIIVRLKQPNLIMKLLLTHDARPRRLFPFTSTLDCQIVRLPEIGRLPDFIASLFQSL